jgi:26S proteasome regulatory subunit N1
MLGRQQVFLELSETECEDVEDIADIMSNVHLNNNFLALAREVKGQILILAVFMVLARMV